MTAKDLEYGSSHDAPSARDESSAASEVDVFVEHFFRKKAGQLVATLTRLVGTKHIDLAESAVQEAFLKACQTWPYSGIPNNPGAWLTTVARNKALDLIRRQQRFREKEEEIKVWFETGPDEKTILPELDDPAALDDQLRLMFVCCHPSISRRAQMCLTLKTVGGLSVREIARAFLTSEEATRKLIYRAKQTIRGEGLSFDWPPRRELPRRLDAVMGILYLIFNEGYSAYEGNQLVREDLCDEAIWLTSLFLHDTFEDLPRQSSIHALLALMLLQSSRFPARIDSEGNLVVLADQKRSLWDRKRIALGLRHLQHSAVDLEMSQYHVQAQIAACHAIAPSYEAADWPRIVSLYETLLELQPNPIVQLNRAVAVSQVDGPQAGIEALVPILDDPALQEYYLLPATIADLYRRLGDHSEALTHYRRAYSLAKTDVEKRFLERRMAESV